MVSQPVVVPRCGQHHLARLLALVFAAGCSNTGSSQQHPATRAIRAEPDLVAAVGTSAITADILRRAVAKAEGRPQARLAQLVELRSCGLYAQQGGLQQGRRQMAERAVLARALLARIEDAAKSPSTPSDAEVESMTETRWIDLDRPVAAITCHAVVHAQGLDDAGGMSLAQRLADALRPATRCQEFLERANAFPVVGAKITAEPLPPVTADGRTMILDGKGEPVDEGDAFDTEFARAAHQIKAIGEQSSVVRTRFGWHVILLEGRVAEHRVSFEERRRVLTDDILRKRAKDASDRLIVALRQSTSITVERAATETAARVRVDP